MEKYSESRLSYLFAHLHLISSDSFSSTLLSSNLSLLSASALLCFLSVHIVGSLTSKLPSKHISKSKCTKHTVLGPLLEVQMSKKCTPLWCEAHFQVKMYKTPHVRATFGGSDVEKVHAVVARRTFRSEHVQSTRVRTTFGGSDVASPLRFTTLHYVTLHHTPVHYTTLHSTTLQLQLHN